MQYVRVCSTEKIMQDFDIKCLELNISENNQTQSYKCCTSGVCSVEADSLAHFELRREIRKVSVASVGKKKSYKILFSMGFFQNLCLHNLSAEQN